VIKLSKNQSQFCALNGFCASLLPFRRTSYKKQQPTEYSQNPT